MTDIALPTPRRLWLFGLAAIAGWFIDCLAQYANGWWLIDAAGRPAGSNVFGLWSAGKMALAGQAAATYDPAAIAAVQHTLTAPPYAELPWLYPPSFLLVAAAVAPLPYLWACAVWLGGTMLGYAAAIRLILPHPLAMVLALGAGATLINLDMSETGFATACLAGLALAWLDERPILAGVALGLLTVKPQLGLLFPLVLMVSGRWRVFGAAAATTLLLAGLAALLFGVEVWRAYLTALPEVGNITMGDRATLAGSAAWVDIQSWYGLAHYFGAGAALAWTIHAIAAGGTALALCVLWRSDAAYALKAAALATGSFLATPYVMTYDAVLLVVPVAFLIRHGLDTGFRRGDMELCALVLMVPLYALFLKGIAPPLPLVCTVFFFWLIRRASRSVRPA